MKDNPDCSRARIHSAERSAILSSCCGYLGEVTLTDSAVIILYAGILGAGDMLSLLTTSILPLFNGIGVIPMAALVMRRGARSVALRSCAIAAAAYFAAAATPFFGTWQVAALITSLLIFALSLTGFIASWFPMLDGFLPPEARTGFLGRMRFCHQSVTVAFLLAVSLAIGTEPPVWKLQLVLLAAALIFCGRGFFLARIPTLPGREEKNAPEFRTGLLRAAGNRPLAGFSLYLFTLNFAAFGTVPVTMLYLKNGLAAPDNMVVLISAASLGGMLLGYVGAPHLVRRLTLKWMFPLFHLLCGAINLGLFLIGGGGPAACAALTLLLMLYSFLIAAGSIVASAEMMRLAAPGNKVMAMAFSGALSYGGAGLSRLAGSLLLGSGLFAEAWHIGTFPVCRYQTMYLTAGGLIFFFIPLLLLVPAVFPGGPADGRR